MVLGFISARDKSTATPSQTQIAPDAADKKQSEAPTTSTTPHSDDSAVAKSGSSLSIGPSTDTNPRWSLQGRFKLLRKLTAKRLTIEKNDAAAPTPATDAPTDHVKPSSALSLLSADHRAKQSALIVRSFIVGQDTDEGGVASPKVPISRTQLKNIKAQLSKPKTANKVIAQLRALPSFPNSASHASEPIQAVCLPYSDEEADAKRFGTLRNVKLPSTTTATTTATTTNVPSSLPEGSTTINAITDAFKNVHIVNLFTTPGLSLGELAGAEGIFAGALPSAETVINGFTQITPQLMALGYTAGKSLVPNHKGIYPPTDRLSVLTCTLLVHYHVAEISNVCCVDWWGLEILLPPPTLAYLSVSSCALISA